MRLELDLSVADGYKSPSQRVRRMTEAWFESNMYCPACASLRLERSRASTPVVDFQCPSCGAEYQVKAKAGPLGGRLRDAAYEPMIQRVRANRSPHFAFMSYDRPSWQVRGLLLVPGHFLTPAMVQRCKPLNASARRAGWVGCNILVQRIPPDGRLPVIAGGVVTPVADVRRTWDRCAWLAEEKPAAKGWTVDVLGCVRSFGGREFTSDDIYEFEECLRAAHPDNRNVRPKIRQQLQVLRDRGILRFLGRGRYIAE